MVIEHVMLAFSHHMENCEGNSDRLADAMRQELSDTCPEVIWQDRSSKAYCLIQSLCTAVRWDLPDPMSMFVDAIGEAIGEAEVT